MDATAAPSTATLRSVKIGLGHSGNRCTGRRSTVTEVVVAVFDSSLAAEAAVQDLRVARIQTAVVQREVSEPVISEDTDAARTYPTVKVVVDEMHADAVTGILRQYGRLDMGKRTPGGRRAPTGNARAHQRAMGFGGRLATAFS
jgi:hypothetical protein